MINKNLKGLAIFVILTVFLLGAVTVASAADVDAGVANATATGADALNVSQTGANAAQGTINGILTTETQSTNTAATVPAGTLVTAGTLEFTGNVYYTNGTKIEGATIAVANTITFSNGAYSGVVSLTGIDDLDSTQTYYAGAQLKDGKATYVVTSDISYVANIGEYDSDSNAYLQTVYLPFKYISKYNITIADKTVLYGDDWTYSGTIRDANGPVEPSTIYVTIQRNAETPYTAIVNVIAGDFSVNNTAFNTNLSVGTYKVAVVYENDYVATATFIVEPKNVTISPSLNATSTYYNDPSTLTVNLLDEDGYVFKGDTSLTYTIINLNTGVTTTKTGSTNTGKAEEVLSDIIPGNYIIRINGVSDNYNFPQAAIYYNVSSVPTNIVVSETPLVVAKNGDGTLTITVQDNSGNNLTVADNSISVMVFDSTNVPVTTVQNPTDSKYTVSDSLADNGYYLKIDFAAVGYDASTLTVPIVIKEGTAVTVSPATTSYVYGGNTNITVTLTANDGKLLNTTIVILNGNNTIGAIPITNGVGTYSLQNLNLDASDDPYTLTIRYLGDDSYKSSEATETVTVNPIYGLGRLNVDTILVNYNVSEDQTINFNLTNLAGTGLVDYTGVLSYYKTAGEVYNISMVNGAASIQVSDLEDLSSGSQTYRFGILGNNRSNQVSVIVVVKQLSGAVDAENITANNDTEIVISGKITNATDGEVKVTLSSEDGREIATYIADVESDGSFEAQFASLKDGNYTADIVYANGDIGVSNPDDVAKTIGITVEGASNPQPEPTPTPTGEIATILTINDFSEIVDAGKSLTGKLTDINGTPIIGMHITLRLTRLSNGQSKDYSTTTDYKGEFQFPINLAVGNYTAYAEFDGLNWTERNVTYLASQSNVTPFYVLPENKTEPEITGNDTTVIITAEPYVGVYGNGGNFTARFTNINGTPLVGFRDCIEVTLTRLSSGASKTYTYFVPDYRGDIIMPVELAPGEYGVHIEFTGSTVPAVYDPTSYDTTITVTRE